MQVDTNVPIVTAKLVEKLSSKKEAERLEAERVLQGLGPEAINVLLPILGEEAKTRSQRNRTLMICIGVLVGLMVVIGIGHSIAKHEIDWSILSNTFTMCSSLVGVAYAATAVQKNGTKLLAQYDDIRCVGAFAEALEYGDKEIRQTAETKLIALLPRLQASDEGLLNAQQRGCMNRALNSKNTTLVLVILKAYEQVGDESALPYVERLATANSKEQAVTNAARECLPYLQMRVEKAKERLSLLRASSAEATSPELLLRAASGGVVTAPDQLLRASDAREPSVAAARSEHVDTSAYTAPTLHASEQSVQR